MSYITNIWQKHKVGIARLAWFIGLYLTSIIVVGTISSLGHLLVTIFP